MSKSKGLIADNNVDISHIFGIDTHADEDGWRYTWAYAKAKVNGNEIANSPYDSLLNLESYSTNLAAQASPDAGSQVVNMGDHIQNVDGIDFTSLHPAVAARIGAPSADTMDPILSDDSLFQWDFSEQSWEYIGSV